MTRRRTAGTRTVSRRHGGRPSREDAALLGERILDVATELFLAEGYGATSIDAIARRARISKRTFYHRFPDKTALFGAVIHRIVERLRPPPDIPLFEGGNLDEILRRLARLILRAVLAPTALSLHRLLVAERRRFPELAAVAAREGSRDEAVKQIAAMIDREARASGRVVDRPQLAAEQFLEFVIAVPRRRALGLGTKMSEAELNAWADDCVALFFNGCRAGIESRWVPKKEVGTFVFRGFTSEWTVASQRPARAPFPRRSYEAGSAICFFLRSARISKAWASLSSSSAISRSVVFAASMRADDARSR